MKFRDGKSEPRQVPSIPPGTQTTPTARSTSDMSVETDAPGERSLKKSKDRSSRKSKHSDSYRSSEKKRKRHGPADDQPCPSKKPRSNGDTLTSHAPVPTSLSLSDSPFVATTCALYFPLSPILQFYPLEGLCAEHLSPLILTYYPPFHGVVLSYNNPRLSEEPSIDGDSTEHRALAKSINEYAASFVWITADFLIFRPQQGQWIEGHINLQSGGHIGLVCWNLFNASIQRQRLPKDWVWIRPGGDMLRPDGSEKADSQTPEVNGEERAEGCYRDSKGNKVQGMLRFLVRDVDISFDRDKGFMSIEGSLLDEEEEKRLVKETLVTGRGHGAIKSGRAIRPSLKGSRVKALSQDTGGRSVRTRPKRPNIE